MPLKYSAKPSCASRSQSPDWYVSESAADGKSGWIVCYCWGEAQAKEIAQALNLLDSTRETPERSKP